MNDLAQFQPVFNGVSTSLVISLSSHCFVTLSIGKKTGGSSRSNGSNNTASIQRGGGHAKTPLKRHTKKTTHFQNLPLSNWCPPISIQRWRQWRKARTAAESFCRNAGCIIWKRNNWIRERDLTKKPAPLSGAVLKITDHTGTNSNVVL
jgi:hypothetical protein